MSSPNPATRHSTKAIVLGLFVCKSFGFRGMARHILVVMHIIGSRMLDVRELSLSEANTWNMTIVKQWLPNIRCNVTQRDIPANISTDTKCFWRLVLSALRHRPHNRPHRNLLLNYHVSSNITILVQMTFKA